MDAIETAPLPYLLALPDDARAEPGATPVLCFLHGYDEAAPTPMVTALTRHGPLHPANARHIAPFIVIAPQLPVAGDLWHRYFREVSAIVAEVQALHGGDHRRTCLTGFSFGGNGVFDLALADPTLWAALWPVDPTRVPPADSGHPLWLSFGEVSRRQRERFIRDLGLQQAGGTHDERRTWLDQGADHAGSARLAYGDERIYAWLLRQCGGVTGA